MDAIHYKVRSEGRVITKAAYTAIGVDLKGVKDVLGIWVGENESAKFWLSVINEIKNRGVKDTSKSTKIPESRVTKIPDLKLKKIT